MNSNTTPEAPEMTKHYIGTKIVMALAMTRLAYNEYRGWDLPADENGADEGYLVEYTDGGAPNHPGHAGYISWSPKAQFDAGYVAIGDVGHLPPHQQRVVAELEQLADRVKKLEAFLATPLYASLPGDEQQLLKMQADAMVLYMGILNTRAAKFS
ncbi:crAss001_48 related protein [Pseudomonas urethralis]|uniref:crAss001_48 related protein n=1 Tax=Pseudomonas urethralis TaxID=2740517 RepID=UPI001F226736|nr:hypothetical protein [Pseudomonas urethralis]